MTLDGFHRCHVTQDTSFDFLLSLSSSEKQEWNVYHGKGKNAAIGVDSFTISFLGCLFFVCFLNDFLKAFFRCWLENIYNWLSIKDVLY